ncbi:radical SAM protein [Streptomyces botrytidirepellens]|uniref:Radical SAM protein n=1 Tax=Streptomyces botrytidirepellens TaxID=2486417 RepID=A0A3M8XBZ8_9ACTN|nr:radical SAM protein [Streptomyces botrytidirepellens]RNG37993.1 radical SAM protein [Streptomyces botrytidirepellens]
MARGYDRVTTIAPEAPTTLRFLSLEITNRCQLTCPTICYAESGPTRNHGSMTEDDWNRTIDEAASLGAEEIQLIGGEPTLHPAFARMLQRAVGAGLRVRAYSNLVRIRVEHLRLFEHPNVRLATTYHSGAGTDFWLTAGRRNDARLMVCAMLTGPFVTGDTRDRPRASVPLPCSRRSFH